ncbi:zn 2cys6 cluster transcripitional activator [Colletotrichum chrysophilum]|uniref:Zn 2cys6 cluster transcripitional activator n=1 Tax=Colletotrichum chrysophilum TaxID=1836956 RepID=A0AAD9AP32_9PEZI|nr:zn 2cys6 cluster transcripitional activator [Colletotrichum chrysophilum]
MPLINNTDDVALDPVPLTFQALPVIVAGKHDTFWLFHLRIRRLQTIEETMDQIHQFFNTTDYRNSPAIPRGRFSNLFLKTSIRRAEISRVDVSNGDPEAATLPRKVTITADEYSPDLTAFFRRPSLSKYCDRFANRYPDVLCDAAQTKFILIHYEMSKTAVGIAAGLGVVFWLLISALIGVVRKRLETGVTVAGVGIGVMALFVAVIKGVQK